MGFGAKADGRRQGLTRQHMRPVQVAVDHAIKQHLPVGLRLKGHKEAFILEIPLLVGDGERGHIGELDKAEGQILDFRQCVGVQRGCAKCCDQRARDDERADHMGILWLRPGYPG